MITVTFGWWHKTIISELRKSTEETGLSLLSRGRETEREREKDIYIYMSDREREKQKRETE